MSLPLLRPAMAMGLALLCLGPLAAKDESDHEGAKKLITIRLEPTRYNAGRSGTALLVPVGDQTGITLTISGVPTFTSRPIHLSSTLIEGSCENRNAGKKHALNDHVLAESIVHSQDMGAFSGPVRITHRVALPFEKLKTTPFAISVRLTPADGNQEIFCGNSPR